MLTVNVIDMFHVLLKIFYMKKAPFQALISKTKNGHSVFFFLSFKNNAIIKIIPLQISAII